MSCLNTLAQDIYQTAKEKGWYDRERGFPEQIALMHSELSEALESWRNGEGSLNSPAAAKPEGWGVELIDCIIRILDACAHFNLNIEQLLQLKLEYNRLRPYRHGNKRC